MMKYLQRLGKSLMLPVACLPVASILMGIGYWIDPNGWGANNVAAAFLIKAGSALIDNMAILFAIGVGVGMSDDNDGAAGLAGLVSWLMITTLLSVGSVAFLKQVDTEAVPAAFSKIETQFIGIIAGIIGAECYNRFKHVKLPMALSFFSGKRSVAIMSGLVSVFVSVILFFAWPTIYGGLVTLGKAIVGTGAIGAGIYAFLNRLLIPFGLHHALNSVFWFDVAGINDIGNFWGTSETTVGTLGQTGMYMSGFFPVMMFGLPAGALAMYHCAKENKKKTVAGLFLASAFASFFTGVTEPLEFAFMFLAPGLYVLHAGLTGISAFLVTMIGPRAGFNFSAGLIDYVLSFNAPMAVKPLWLVPLGIAFGIIYYALFRFVIKVFNLSTPGREDDDEADASIQSGKDKPADNTFIQMAAIILEGLGGKENIKNLDNCITRLRLEVHDLAKVNDKKIKSAGIAGIMRPGKNSIQVVVGTQVQHVADEMKKMIFK